MTPFLRQIAEHYCGAGDDLSRMLFVFPSQRAVVFFRKYLGEVVRETGAGPVIAPLAMSVDDFLTSLNPTRQEDRLSLLIRLYKCYGDISRKYGQECESLDEFVFWGDVILKDFDDVDKYLIDARNLFRNVGDLKNLSDDFSYLTSTQKEALESFLGKFRTGGEYKLRFARLWNMLGELYDAFNASLDSDSVSYAAKAARSIVSRISAEGGSVVFKDAFPDTDKAVFCGLNALCECEKQIFLALKKAGLAEFCWDACSDWIKDPFNKSSLLMRDNISLFGQSVKLLKCEAPSCIEVVRVPSAIGQTKVVSDLLEDISISPDERTAIILTDETLLQPMLNSIPERVKEVNVTMGYSMSCSSFYSLMSSVAQLQLNVRMKNGNAFFYHRHFWNIVDNNIFDALLNDVEREALAGIRAGRSYYIDSRLITDADGLMGRIFTPVIDDIADRTGACVRKIEDYQIEILMYIGRRIASDEQLKEKFALELDYAMEYVKSVTLLSGKCLTVLPQTYFSLLDNLLRSKSVPLKGEPLTGLQIMGPLETRALDFDNIFILGCNEGVFPRSGNPASFIPPLLRYGFGLPASEYQDAVWAYYFYRMIQRPSRIWMLLDSRSEGLKSGEESRYVKQLKYHFKAGLHYSNALSITHSVSDEGRVKKTDEDIAVIRSKTMSVSALKDYLACGMKFYYAYVKGLKAEDDVNENMDAGIIGNVFHNTMEHLYKVGTVKDSELHSILGDKALIRSAVEEEIKKEMNTDEITGRDIVYCEIICRYVRKTIERDVEFMRISKVDSFEILALETTYYGKLGGLSFKGRVDRVDSFIPGVVRLVDYKTGRVLDKDVNIDDETADDIAKLIFSKDTKNSDRPEIALQFYVYDRLLEQDKSGIAKGKTLVNSVYSTRSILQSLPAEVRRNDAFCAAMEPLLAAKISEILNPDEDFVRKELEYEDRVCGNCDFKKICGR